MRTWKAVPLALTLALTAPWAAAQTCPVLATQNYVSGLSSPLLVTNAGDGSNRVFVVEKAGVIKVVQPGQTSATVFMTIPSTKVDTSGERGLLGLAFHPGYETNHRFFVAYASKPNGAIVLAEYHATGATPAVEIGDPNSEIVHFTIPHNANDNHNGGMIGFGPGGYLFMSVGDGGSGDDPPNNAQNINLLLGKFLRVNIDTVPYSSPADNPFFGATPGRDEIYAVGVRNTWRWSFDPETNKLIAGDVGQGQREEVDYIERSKNYGWRVMEGSRCNISTDTLPCNSPAFTGPILEYSHTAGRCSITGGYVYRGDGETLADGQYVYGDFCTGEIFGVDVATLPLPTGPISPTVLLDLPFQLASFGQDEAGELFAADINGGKVNRLVSATRPTTNGAEFDDEGGPGSVSVVAPGDMSCAIWTAASNASWLDITSGGGIRGNGTVNYTVEPNPNETPRTGTMTIAGHTFTVTQGASAVVTIAVDDVSVDEGNSGTASATFLVTLSGVSGGDVTVQYATAPGTATATTDYTSKPLTTLTFAPGETSKPVTVLVKGDTKDEPDETFFLNLSNATGASLEDGQAVGTIVDDDPTPALSIGDASVTETAGNKSVSLTVALSAASDQTVTVDYATGPGTATVGTEYTAESGTLSFTPGQLTRTISIATHGDLVDEPNETFVVNLTNPSHATLADAQAVVTIVDDDPAAPTINASISDATVTEGNTTGQTALLTVTLSGTPTQTVKVGYTTAPNTASAGADFGAKMGTLTFSPGQTSKTLKVNVKGDLVDENTESFFVNLQAPQGIGIADGQGVVTINDNDAPPSLSVNDVAVLERNVPRSATFTVTLSAPSSFTVTVNYATANGSATQPADYTAANGTLTFAPGQTSRTVVVTVVGDMLVEPTEAFTLVLSAPTNASLGDASGTATITDNDGV